MSTSKLVVLQPSKQQLTDYANALIEINSYAYAITNQSMPVLNEPPKDYSNFAAEFAPAKQHALNWSTNIFVSVVQLPKTIKQQTASLFSMEETMIEAYLQMLITDPTNSTAKTNLSTALSTVKHLISQQVSTIEGIETSLDTFSTNIQADAKVLTKIAQDALTDAGADQQTIEKINQDIENLKSEIKTAQTLLTVSEIGIGLSIFVGLIGAVVCFLPVPGARVVGAGLITTAVAGEAASIAGTVIENERINAMQDQIVSDGKQIDELKQDIIMLKALSSQFNDLYNANLQAQNALKSVKSMWKSLDSAITEVQSDLTKVDSDVSSAQYQQALNDFKDAETAWADVVAFADALAGIDYSWQSSDGKWHKYSSTGDAPTLDGSKVEKTDAAKKAEQQEAVA